MLTAFTDQTVTEINLLCSGNEEFFELQECIFLEGAVELAPVFGVGGTEPGLSILHMHI
jgi:hypothetical protein